MRRTLTRRSDLPVWPDWFPRVRESGRARRARADPATPARPPPVGLKYYTEALHPAAFQLPAFARAALGAVAGGAAE